jgi:hypothetical protein
MSFTVQPEKHVKRDATVYARVQGDNKKFIATQAKALGFESDAAYLDAVLTKVRVTASTAKKAYKKKAKTKK